MDINWNEELVSQLEWHWDNQLRPRLDGLTDDEYFWAPAADYWTISRRGESTAPISVGAGEFTVDYAIPEPEPAPVTTIAWRLAHIIVAVFGMRNAVALRRPGRQLRDVQLRRHGEPRRCASSTMRMTPGSRACADSVPTVSRSRAGRPRARSPSTRWRPWSCTSTGRQSITAPRSRCSATCTCGEDLGAELRRYGELV